MKLTQALTSAIQLRKDNIGTMNAGRSRTWKRSAGALPARPADFNGLARKLVIALRSSLSTATLL